MVFDWWLSFLGALEIQPTIARYQKPSHFYLNRQSEHCKTHRQWLLPENLGALKHCNSNTVTQAAPVPLSSPETMGKLNIISKSKTEFHYMISFISFTGAILMSMSLFLNVFLFQGSRPIKTTQSPIHAEVCKSIFKQVVKQLPCKWKTCQFALFTNPFLLATWR